MNTRPIMRLVCLMLSGLFVLSTPVLAQTELPFDPKKGGIEGKGPGKTKPTKIPVGGKTAPRPFKPDMSRIIPQRIEIFSADPPRGVITRLHYDEPFQIRLVFTRRLGRDTQEIVLSQGERGASILLIAKRVKRTKVFETGVVILTRGKRSVTRARDKFPFRPGMGPLVAEARPSKKKMRIVTITASESEEFQEKIKTKAAPKVTRITRKYEGASAKYEETLAVRWSRFLARRKRLEDRMQRAADRCDRARYAKAEYARDRDYEILRKNLRAERDRYLALIASSKPRTVKLDSRLDTLQERWNFLAWREKRTSPGEKLVSIAAKYFTERWELSNKITLLKIKLLVLGSQIGRHRRLTFRYQRDLSRCPPSPVRTIGVVPYGAYKDRGEGSSSNGKIVFACRDLQCTGTYKGSAEGTPAVMVGVFNLRTATFNGFWAESKSRRKCATKMHNSYYWGRVKFVFKQDARSWSGKWGHCTGSLSKSWHGRK